MMNYEDLFNFIQIFYHHELFFYSRSIKHFVFVILFADPIGVTVQNSTVLFTDHDDGKVYTTDLDGRDKTPIANSSDPWGIVVDHCVR